MGFIIFLEKQHGEKVATEAQRDFYFHLSSQLHLLTIEPWNNLDHAPVLKEAVEERTKEIDQKLDDLNDLLDKLS